MLLVVFSFARNSLELRPIAGLVIEGNFVVERLELIEGLLFGFGFGRLHCGGWRMGDRGMPSSGLTFIDIQERPRQLSASRILGLAASGRDRGAGSICKYSTEGRRGAPAGLPRIAPEPLSEGAHQANLPCSTVCRP